jgi:hypothetical protein
MHQEKRMKSTTIATGIIMIVGAVHAKKLDSTQAKILASDLANKKCDSLFHARPFNPDDYKAEFKDGTWIWGKIDPSGKNGYSAEVRFKKNGKNPLVKVVLTNDEDETWKRQAKEENEIK